MKNAFDIIWEDRTVGKATMEKIGLFYQIHCRCNRVEDGLCRVVAITSGSIISIGICVPCDMDLVTSGKIAINRFDLDDLQFRIIRETEMNERCYRIYCAQPFSKIELLRLCTFVRKQSDDCIEVIYGRSDSDQPNKDN